MTPRQELRELCGTTETRESRKDFARRKYFVCRAEFVSISRFPERNRFTDFGSPPILMRALWISNGDFFDNSLSGKEISRNLEFVDISSTLRVSKTRPLRGHCKLVSVSVIQTLFWRASTHHGVQQGRQCTGHLAKTRNSAYLEYTQNIVIQHQGEDPTGKPITPYLQHYPYSSVSSVSPKRVTTSRLTGAGSLLPPIYCKEWAKGIPRTPFASLRDAAHGKHAGWLSNGINRTQIKQHNQNTKINLRKGN
ncbi:hypothetical protein TNCV_3621551 [Trichonephila clavipes]|nr:hypothetical protein TNCV_3621551 [Trichonephila clavipes]